MTPCSFCGEPRVGRADLVDGHPWWCDDQLAAALRVGTRAQFDEALAAHLRGLGWSYAAIGRMVGASRQSVRVRLLASGRAASSLPA